jgi:hypothetical protein
VIDISKRVSRGTAVFWLTISIVVVGVILVVQTTSGPAYEATAKIVIGFEGDPPPDLVELTLNEQRKVLESAELAQLAASMVADLAGPNPTESFAWYASGSLSTDCPSCGLDAASIEKNLRIKIGKDRDASQISVMFRADDPAVARVGANVVAEAYRRILDGTDLGIASGSLAPTPVRMDAVEWRDVGRFVLASMLVVYFTWAWWPGARRQYERPDHVDRLLGIVGVVVLLVGLLADAYWLMLGLLFAVGLWSVGSLLGRYLDLLARYVQKSKHGRD